jgi:GTPase SAR1 family protein
MVISAYEIGLKTMGELTEQFSQADAANRNEATTRLHIIDRIFFDALQWPRDNCILEESYEKTYTDYVFSNTQRQMIVEAKKEGVYFELPLDQGSREVSLPVLVRSNGNLGQALRQVGFYCTNRGVPIAVACNGHQLIAFIGSRTDGIAPTAGRAVIFRSLQEMHSDFLTLWNCLSHPAIERGYLESLLVRDSLPPAPEKLSRQLPYYPGVKKRNELEHELRILGEIFLQDLVKDTELERDFLEECYCSSGALSQYALISKEILKHRYSTSGEGRTKNVTAASGRSGATNELLNAVLAKSVTRRPVILLGDVGVGKTSFIKHLVSVEAKEELKRGIVLYVDFGREPALRTDLQDYVLDSFERQLREDHRIDLLSDSFVRGIYHGDLVAMRTGIYGFLHDTDPTAYRLKEVEFLAAKISNKSGHLKRAIEHLISGERRTIVAFLDNIDQRSDDFQEEVFLIAQSLAESWPITCFATLRPSTYNKSRRQGSLSAYQNRVFTISPPRIDLVVRKRLEYALNKLIDGGMFALASEGITVESHMLREYIEVLIESMARNEALAECIDNISAGNVRDALDLLTNFVGSGHVDTRKILDIKEKSGSYYIPLHEFIRAVIYGDNEYYSPEASFVANLFDVVSPTPEEHFLTSFMVDYCMRSSQHSIANKGFIAEGDVYDHLRSLGYHNRQISAALARAEQSKLLDFAEADQSSSNRVRITQRGAYVLHRLMATFVYIDAVVIDTPIIDTEFRGLIWNARLIRDRVERARHFLGYLDTCWEGAPRVAGGFDWANESSKIFRDITAISERLSRLRGE